MLFRSHGHLHQPSQPAQAARDAGRARGLGASLRRHVRRSGGSDLCRGWGHDGISILWEVAGEIIKMSLKRLFKRVNKNESFLVESAGVMQRVRACGAVGAAAHVRRGRPQTGRVAVGSGCADAAASAGGPVARLFAGALARKGCAPEPVSGVGSARPAPPGRSTRHRGRRTCAGPTLEWICREYSCPTS